MPLPTREERAAARKRDLALQQKRNAERFAASGSDEHDAAAATEAKAARKAKQAKAEARRAETRRPGSRRTVPSPSKAKAADAPKAKS
jgi:hypothetical protein